MAKRGNKKEDNKNEDKDPQNWTQIVITFVGAVATIIVALIGILPSLLRISQESPTPTEIPTNAIITPTVTLLTDTPIPPIATPSLIFKDTFDNNNSGWGTDQAMGDFNTSGYKAYVHINNGKYYREMESNNSFTRTYGAQPIPHIAESNFCLIFDSRAINSPQDTAIVIVVRAIGWDSYYYIGFNVNGGGAVRLINKQIGNWTNGIVWTDDRTHTVKISFQDDELEIYDGQTNALLFSKNLTGDNLVTNEGQIKFGFELFHPNQKATVEFDNVFIYDKCP